MKQIYNLIEPDWSDSETLPTEMWKNSFIPMNDRLEVADGAIAFRDATIANLRKRLKFMENQVEVALLLLGS